MVDPSKDTLPNEEPELSKIRETDWPAVLFFIHIHLLSLYGIWLLLFGIKLLTFLLRKFIVRLLYTDYEPQLTAINYVFRWNNPEK